MTDRGAEGRPTYRALSAAFLRISLLGFGGPNAHLALMLDEIVEKRRWVSREHFLHLIGLTNLLPGPNSSEVAIHVGYTQRGWRGALVTGLSFLAPTFVFVVVLSSLYFRYGTLPAAEAVFWGLKPVIVAVILGAGWRLGRTAVTDGKLLALALGGVAVALFLSSWEVVAMAGGGLIAWWMYRDREEPAEGDVDAGEGGGPAPSERFPEAGGTSAGGRDSSTEAPAPAPGRLPALAFVPMGTLALGAGELGRLLWLTAWSGAVLFGGGYMLVALLQPYVVDQYGWLTSQQFLDGIALTQAVPGPIVTLVAFVGYGVAGVPGAAVATFGIYLPSFAAVLAVAPFLERWRHVGWVRAVLKGVNAVVAGAILGVALALVPLAVPDLWAGLLLAAALVAVFRFRVGAMWLVLAGLAIGILRYVTALP